MNKKNATKKRLVCYLSVTFLITWAPMFLFIASGEKYDATKPGTNLLLTFAMLCPAIGTFITRAVTKEGFALTGENSLLLGIRFQNKKWIWYLAAFAFPFLYGLINNTLWFLFVPGGFNPDMLEKNGMTPFSVFEGLILCVMSAVFMSFGALGEELGWRTYLYPKLEELFGLKKALLIGGIIWGIWHFPMVAVGHVGTGYFGEPYTGFLFFAIMTTGIGCLAYLVTKKTQSVWPAVFLHAFNNTNPYPLLFFMDMDKATGFFKDGLFMQITNAAAIWIVVLITLPLWKEKKTRLSH